MPIRITIKPVMIRICRGTQNFISNNFIDAITEESKKEREDNDSCFEAQVGALLGNAKMFLLPIVAVMIDEGAIENIVLDCGREEQMSFDKTQNTFRGF